MCPAVAYEMLVSHSPPLFSHSPPTGFLSDYPYRLNPELNSKISRGGNCRSSIPPPTLSFSKRPTQKILQSPIRPCLVIRPEEPLSPGNDDPQSPTKLKKKVVFADDKGMSLTHVRVMTEPSNVPPLWSLRFLSEVTQGIFADPEVTNDPWEIDFQQPLSDYVAFRKKLEIGKVSLENVLIKENNDIILGTIKVSNINYQKEVIVRATFDNWKTFEDIFCTYVPNPNSVNNMAYIIYDTFSFKIPLRPKARQIEFCICYKCNGNDYWDNNSGKNYIIAKKLKTLHKSYSADDILKTNLNNKSVKHRTISTSIKCSDVTHAKLDSWSEFASWNNNYNNNKNNNNKK